AAADAAWAAGDAAGCLQALPRGEDPAGRDAVPSAADYAHGLRALLEGRFPAAARRLGRLVADTETGELPDVPETSLRAAAAALMLGDLPAARRAGTRALAADHGTGGGVAALAREYLAYTELRAGRHAVARTHAEEGLRAAHRTGRRNTAAHHHAALALAASVDSGLAEVAVHARAALAVARRHGLVQAATLAEWATARADLGHGRPREAADRLGPLVRPGPRRGHFAVWMSAVPCYVEATVSAGRADGGDRRDDGGQGGGRERGDGRQREGGEAAEVVAVIEEFARWAGFGADPQAPAQLLRCRALLAPPDRTDALYRSALGLHDRADGDFERARTELSYGKWLRRRRRLREARDRLGAALVGFERCGARAWAEQARAELRALGVSAGARTGTAPGLSGLTPQQLRIARWVAEGATNREVALALSVSTRTVDYHLRKAFAALGVRSRVELARLVERAQPPPDGTGTEIGTSGGHTEIDRAHP
ncbi:helix-turn-helix transcriptional regulator, partial [Streptomyces sp. S9]|nr:helix-turn-helix transcriptional regulator [Streptomyces sp. S9]